MKKINVSEIYGRIKFVDSRPDYKVQIDDFSPHLKVQTVTKQATLTGQWEIVENKEDFRIQMVDILPDFKIKYVDFFPGEVK